MLRFRGRRLRTPAQYHSAGHAVRRRLCPENADGRELLSGWLAARCTRPPVDRRAPVRIECRAKGSRRRTVVVVGGVVGVVVVVIII